MKFVFYPIRSRRGVLDTTLCDKVCQWLASGWWFSMGTPVSSTNKTDCHDITEILLKVTLNNTKQTNCLLKYCDSWMKVFIVFTFKMFKCEAPTYYLLWVVIIKSLTSKRYFIVLIISDQVLIITRKIPTTQKSC